MIYLQLKLEVNIGRSLKQKTFQIIGVIEISRLIYSIAESEYAPGTVAGPRIAKNGFDLPSARKLSTTVTKTSANQDRRDGVSTVLVMQMGQFIDHDFAHAPNFQNDPPNCCDTSLDKSSIEYKEKCFPIDIPADDSYFQSIGRRCMDFHRSMPSPNLNCEMGKREQVKIIFLHLF